MGIGLRRKVISSTLRSCCDEEAVGDAGRLEAASGRETDAQRGCLGRKPVGSSLRSCGCSLSRPKTPSTVAMTLVVAALSVPLAWMAGALVSPQAADLEAFQPDGPSAGRVAVVACIAMLAGVFAGAVGLLVGALTRNRTFTVAAFSVAYLLLPILGPADPRNLLAAAGSGSLYFVGQFRPTAIGENEPIAAAGALLALAVVCCAAAVVPWLVRGRTEQVA